MAEESGRKEVRADVLDDRPGRHRKLRSPARPPPSIRPRGIRAQPRKRLIARFVSGNLPVIYLPVMERCYGSGAVRHRPVFGPRRERMLGRPHGGGTLLHRGRRRRKRRRHLGDGIRTQGGRDRRIRSDDRSPGRIPAAFDHLTLRPSGTGLRGRAARPRDRHVDPQASVLGQSLNPLGFLEAEAIVSRITSRTPTGEVDGLNRTGNRTLRILGDTRRTITSSPWRSIR